LHRLRGDAKTIGETLLLAPLNEIRDLLAARLPVPVEVSEVDRLRKENADLRAELAALKAADKPGRWVVFDPQPRFYRYYDGGGWHALASECLDPWGDKAVAELFRESHETVINLDDHKETP
jgi:hypothetical protein